MFVDLIGPGLLLDGWASAQVAAVAFPILLNHETSKSTHVHPCVPFILGGLLPDLNQRLYCGRRSYQLVLSKKLAILLVSPPVLAIPYGECCLWFLPDGIVCFSSVHVLAAGPQGRNQRSWVYLLHEEILWLLLLPVCHLYLQLLQQWRIHIHPPQQRRVLHIRVGGRCAETQIADMQCSSCLPGCRNCELM